jgi:hypothetical protein
MHDTTIDDPENVAGSFKTKYPSVFDIVPIFSSRIPIVANGIVFLFSLS